MKTIKIKMNRAYSINKPKGFSLIEFLVASMLGIIVLVAVGSGYFAARKVNDVAGGRLDVQQDLRNTANLVVRDSRMAGSFGCFNLSNADTTITQTASGVLALDHVDGTNHYSEGVKSVARGDFATTFPSIANFTPSSDAVVFQYGMGAPAVSAVTKGSSGSLTINTNSDTAAEELTAGSPIVVSSCKVLDQVSVGNVGGNASSKTLSGFALNTNLDNAELSVLRYMVNVYVTGAPTGGQAGLYRFQLGNNGNWEGPQLLISGVNGMNVLYGYVNGCPSVDPNAADGATEDFRFFNTLQATPDDRARPLAMIRMVLNGNSLAATGKTFSASGVQENAGNVFVYNIDANIRGGNRCADRTL